MPPEPARWKRALRGSAGILACGFTEHPCSVLLNRVFKQALRARIKMSFQQWLVGRVTPCAPFGVSQKPARPE